MQYLPVVFAVFQIFFLPGLVIYYIVQTVLRIAQQVYITRRFYGHDEALGRQAQRAGEQARELAKQDGGGGGMFGQAKRDLAGGQGDAAPAKSNRTSKAGRRRRSRAERRRRSGRRRPRTGRRRPARAPAAARPNRVRAPGRQPLEEQRQATSMTRRGSRHGAPARGTKHMEWVETTAKTVDEAKERPSTSSASARRRRVRDPRGAASRACSAGCAARPGPGPGPADPGAARSRTAGAAAGRRGERPPPMPAEPTGRRDRRRPDRPRRTERPPMPAGAAAVRRRSPPSRDGPSDAGDGRTRH